VVGGVRDGEEAVAGRAEPVGEQVVEHAAVLAREDGVLRAVRGQFRDVVGEDALKKGLRARPGRLDLAHVGDVEDPGRHAHGVMLLADARVLDRHLPSGEGHEARSRGQMAVVQGRALERLRSGQDESGP
jgi:hypothetical protein